MAEPKKNISPAGKNKSPADGAKQQMTQLFLRHDFYKAGMEKSTKLAIVASVIAALAMITTVVVIVTKPSPQNYAITPSGQLILMKPMSEGVSESTIADFASRAIMTAFSMDFDHVEDDAARAMPYFTEAGYQSYLSAINSGLTETIKNNRLVTSVGFIHPPVITKSSEVGGIQQYVVQAIVSIALNGQQNSSQPKNYIVQMLIERVPENRYPIGIAIQQFIVKEQ